MIMSTTSTPVESGFDPNASSEDEQQEALDELRLLLFGEQRTEIVQLQKKLEDPQVHAENVSQALPQAIQLRHQQDDSLAEALEPIVESSLERTIKGNLSLIAEALYPVIGPAIRRAISAALQNMILSMNQVIDHNFTAQGLKWRVEAWRSGCSVAEVALRSSLVYRVEQVFLIHRDTGLPLLHVAQPGQEGNESLIAGMLTAIQDFVRDSFNAKEGDGLDVVQVGELTIWIERGPQAVLAAVVRGTAPPTLRGELQQVSETIHRKRATLLSSFSGDAKPFEGDRRLLEDCLAEFHRPSESSPAKVIVLLAVLGLVGLWFLGQSILERSRRSSLLASLRSEPGIVVVSAETEGGAFMIRGLRDPLASDPTSLRAAAGLEPGQAQFTLARFHSFEPTIVLARAREVLRPPAGITLSLRSGQLTAEGSASTAWIQRARTVAETLPGVNQYVDSGVLDDEERLVETWRAAVERIELTFARGSVALLPGQEEKQAALVRALQSLAKQRPATQMVLIIRLGPEQSTQRALAEARWAALRQYLIKAGVSAAILSSTQLQDSSRPGTCRLRVVSRGA